MNLPVVFVYRGIRVTGPSLVGVPDLDFGSVQQLLASAGFVVESYDILAQSRDTYQAFWHDANEWAHPDEKAEPGRVLIAVEKSWASRGITLLKRLIARDKEVAAFVARYPSPSISENRDLDEAEPMNNRIFVIHGHDKDTLEKLTHTLREIGLAPVTFTSAKKRGACTNIEILEQTLPEVQGFICLMTPDDEGRKRGKNSKGKKFKLRPRARQNVLVEAGYAILSKRPMSVIIALGDVQIPSDFDGINDVRGRKWSDSLARRLAKRLQDMGFDVDVAPLLES